MVCGTPELRSPGHSARHSRETSVGLSVGEFRKASLFPSEPLALPVLTTSQKSGGRVTPGHCCPETAINHTPMPQPLGATRVPSIPLWGKSWGVAEVTPLPFLLERVGSSTTSSEI